jgi:hypothetical protein
MNCKKLHILVRVLISLPLISGISAQAAQKKPGIVLTMPPVLAAQGRSSPPSGWWQPGPGTSWQWQLSGTIDTSFKVKMYDIDFQSPSTVINTLHGQGKKVICYMSVGSWEDYRADANLYPAVVLGNTLAGWPDEKWVDIRRLDLLRSILEARMDTAVQQGCDGIEPDNVDGYLNNTGFPLTAGDQLTFNKWIAQQAHLRKLSVGLKNDLDQIGELEPFFDWALNETCFHYNECAPLLQFVSAGKAVFGVEYNGDPGSFCPAANASNFDWLKKNPELDAWRYSCR